MRDSSTPKDFDPDRRKILEAGAATALGALAGCSTRQDNNPGTNEDRNDFDEPELGEVVDAELGRPGEESQFTLNEEETDHIKHLSIDGEQLIQDGEIQKNTYSNTYETVQKVNIEAELEEIDGNSQVLENEYTTEAWDWEGLLRNEFKLENGERGLFDSILPRDWEIQNPDKPSKQLERAHIYVQEALGTTQNYQTKQAYPLAMRSAAMNDLEINPEQLPILERSSPLGTKHLAAPVKGEDKGDLGIGFSGEANYIRHDEPITQEEKSSSTASALARYRDGASNPLNVMEVRDLDPGDQTEMEKTVSKKLSRANDHMYVMMRDHLQGREWGATSFEREVGEYMADLKWNNEHIEKGSKFLNNLVGENEYMQTKVGDSREELEDEYGTVVDDIEGMIDGGEIMVTTEMNGKVFGATKVEKEKHIEEAIAGYQK